MDGVFLRGKKRPGHEVHHSPSFPPPNAFMACTITTAVSWKLFNKIYKNNYIIWEKE
jgi:hypothetical protein